MAVALLGVPRGTAQVVFWEPTSAATQLPLSPVLVIICCFVSCQILPLPICRYRFHSIATWYGIYYNRSSTFAFN
jgi:hypothetical protein